MFNQIPLTTVLGFPVVAWGGIFTFLCFATTATFGMLGAAKVPHKYHVWMARLSLLVGLIHGIFGASVFLRF